MYKQNPERRTGVVPMFLTEEWHYTLQNSVISCIIATAQPPTGLYNPISYTGISMVVNEH